MAGTGPMLNELRARASGLPVEFLGHLDGAAAVARLLRESDIALAPCGVETFGLAALATLGACTIQINLGQNGQDPFGDGGLPSLDAGDGGLHQRRIRDGTRDLLRVFEGLRAFDVDRD